jgi:AcrR family transcriptional regulator
MNPATKTPPKPRTRKRAAKAEAPERALRADARRNHEAVLAAARELFAEQGLEAQMPDVAKAADVGVGTVYRHFPTKEDLIRALADDRFRRLAERARDALGEEDPWEAFQGFIRFSAEIQAEDRGLCEVMGSRADIMEAAAEAAGLPELSDQLVKRAQRSGELRSDVSWEDVPMIACGLGRITQAQEGPAAGRWPRLLAIVLDGLRAPGAERLPRVRRRA